MNYNLTFGAWAYKKRKCEGPKPGEVLEALGLGEKSQAHLYRLYRGKSQWTINNMADLAALYGVSLGELIFEFERENGLVQPSDALEDIRDRLLVALEKANAIQAEMEKQREPKNNPAT